MEYKALAEVYARLEGTPKRLGKTLILSQLLAHAPQEDLARLAYLVQGQVFPIWDERKLGMSSMLILKVIGTVTGASKENVVKVWKKMGDLGKVAETLLAKNTQTTMSMGAEAIHFCFRQATAILSLCSRLSTTRKTQFWTLPAEGE